MHGRHVVAQKLMMRTVSGLGCISSCKCANVMLSTNGTLLVLVVNACFLGFCVCEMVVMCGLVVNGYGGDEEAYKSCKVDGQRRNSAKHGLISRRIVIKTVRKKTCICFKKKMRIDNNNVPKHNCIVVAMTFCGIHY